ncbi:hypothetical protein FRB91_011736 [Serendipita sp. 411]|nr:hypothetical protein FRB91_011736 [Serendipita sp. 411]
MDPHGQVYDSTLGFSEDWKRKWMYSSSTSASASTSKRGRVQRRTSLMDVDEGGEAYRDVNKTEEEEKRGRSGYPAGLRSSLPSPPATTRIVGPSSRFPQASTSASTSTSFPRAPPATTTTTAGTSATGHRPQESRGPSTSFSNTISLSHRSQSHSYAATPPRGPPSPPQMSTQSSELPHPLYYRSIDGGGYPRSSLRSSPRLSGSGLGDTDRPTTTVSAPGRREQASPSFRVRQREEGTSAESSSSASFPLSTTPSSSLPISGRSSRRVSRGSAAVSASFSFPPLRRSNVVPLRSTHVTSSSPNTVALRNLPPSSSPSLAPLRPPLSSSSSSMTMDVSESDDDALLSNRLPPLQIPMDEDQRGDASIVSDILGLSGSRIGSTGSEGPSQHVTSSLNPPTTGTPTRRVSPPSVSTPTHLPQPTIAFSQPVWNAQDRTWRLTVIDFEQAALPPLGDAVVWDVDRNAWRLYWSEDGGGGGETRGPGAGPRNVEVVGGASFALWSVEQDAWILES